MDAIAALLSYVLFRERLDNLPVYQPQSHSAILIPSANEGVLSL